MHPTHSTSASDASVRRLLVAIATQDAGSGYTSDSAGKLATGVVGVIADAVGRNHYDAVSRPDIAGKEYSVIITQSKSANILHIFHQQHKRPGNAQTAATLFTACYTTQTVCDLGIHRIIAGLPGALVWWDEQQMAVYSRCIFSLRHEVRG